MEITNEFQPINIPSQAESNPLQKANQKEKPKGHRESEELDDFQAELELASLMSQRNLLSPSQAKFEEDSNHYLKTESEVSKEKSNEALAFERISQPIPQDGIPLQSVNQQAGNSQLMSPLPTHSDLKIENGLPLSDEHQSEVPQQTQVKVQPEVRQPLENGQPPEIKQHLEKTQQTSVKSKSEDGLKVGSEFPTLNPLQADSETHSPSRNSMASQSGLSDFPHNSPLSLASIGQFTPHLGGERFTGVSNSSSVKNASIKSALSHSIADEGRDDDDWASMESSAANSQSVDLRSFGEGPVHKPLSVHDFLDTREVIRASKDIPTIASSASSAPHSSLPTGDFSAAMMAEAGQRMNPLVSTPLQGSEVIAGQVISGAMAKNRLSTDSLMSMSNRIKAVTEMQGAAALKEGGEFRVRLKPDNLGELHIRVIANGNQVGLHIQASDEKAKEVLENSMSSLKESMSAQHLTLAQVDLTVAVSGMNASDSSSDKGQQSAQNGQNPFNGSGDFDGSSNSRGNHEQSQSWQQASESEPGRMRSEKSMHAQPLRNSFSEAGMRASGRVANAGYSGGRLDVRG